MPADAGDAQAVAAMIYFSFVTLTSTGFGDIVPVHPLLRSLANVERSSDNSIRRRWLRRW
jgi:hypothetical protein